MTKTIELSEATAREIYPTAAPEIKAVLDENFGKEFFKMKIMDRIKTWEDAATEYGIDPVKDLPFQLPTSNRQHAANAFFKLDVIAEVLREGVILDWENKDQKKWYAYFYEYKSGAGFRFYDTCYDWTFSNSLGGARLCVDTQEKAKYMGTQFLDIFNQFSNPNN